MSNYKWHISTRFKQNNHYITIFGSHQGRCFSSELCDDFNLKWYKKVNYGVSEYNPYQFAIKFTKNEKDVGFLLHSRSKKSLVCNCSSFLKNDPTIKKLKPKIHNNKAIPMSFPITYNKNEDIFEFTLIPDFEIECHPNKLPSNTVGIYKYEDPYGECIYIGQGDLRRRFLSGDRDTWEISKVCYSIVDDEKYRDQFESIHLDNFE